MALTGKLLKDFAIAKVISVKAAKPSTKEILATMKKLQDFSLNDSTAVEFLRGGETNSKLLAVVGDQDAKVSITSAATNFDWLALQMADTLSTSTERFDGDKIVTVSGASDATISEAKVVRSVVVIDDDSRDAEKLTITTGSTVSTGMYKFESSTGKLTFNADMNGRKVHVYYLEDVLNTQAIKSAGKQTPAIELIVDVVAIDEDTQIPYIAQIYAPKAQLTQSINLTAKNSGVPDGIKLDFDLLYDSATEMSYKLRARER